MELSDITKRNDLHNQNVEVSGIVTKLRPNWVLNINYIGLLKSGDTVIPFRGVANGQKVEGINEYYKLVVAYKNEQRITFLGKLKKGLFNDNYGLKVKNILS